MGCVQAYFRKAHSAGLSPSSTQDSDGLAPDSPLDLKERLLSDEDATPVEAEGDPPTSANGSAKTGNGVGIAAAGAAGAATLLGAATAVDEALALAQQTREDVQKDAEEFVEEVVVEAEKEVEKITSPILIVSATPDEIIITSPSPPSSPVEEDRVVEGEERAESASKSVENEDKPEDEATPEVEATAAQDEAEELQFPGAPQSPELKEEAEEEEVHTRGKRSVESVERAASGAEADEVRPASVVEAESRSESRPASEAKPESESRPQSGSRPASEIKPESESRPASEAKAESESRPHSESRPASEAKDESGSRPHSESRPASEAKSESEIRPQSGSRPASEIKPESESRPPSEAKPESESRPQSENRPASEIKSESESRPPSEAKPESVSRPQSGSRPASEAKVESESRPPSEANAESVSRPVSGAKAESESRPPSEAEAESGSRPASGAKAESESRPSSEAKAESGSRPASEMKPESESRPPSEVKAESESRPQSGSRPASEAKPESESELGNDLTAAIEEAETVVVDKATEGTESPVVDKEDIEQDTGAPPVAEEATSPQPDGSRPASTADVVDATVADAVVDEEEADATVAQEVSDVAVSAATTIQATFRGHQARQNLKKSAGDDEASKPDEVEETSAVEEDGGSKSPAVEGESQIPTVEITEEDFPPPIEEEVESDLTTTNENSEVVDIPGVLETIDDLLPTTEPEATDSQDDRSTARAESESESLGIICETPKSTLDVDDVSRTASNVSESTEDSVTALKGSETESFDALLRLSVVDNDEQQDEKSAASNETNGVDADLDKLETAATTIQASFRGFQTRKDLQKVADDAMLPPPEPSQDFLFGEVVDDDLPPPPDECDLEPPPPAEEAIVGATPDPVTPRSPETGEKVSRSVDLEQEDSTLPGPPDDLNDASDDPPPPPEECTISAEELAFLQRPTMCDELPEHRGGLVNGIGVEDEPPVDDEESETMDAELSELQKPSVCDELPEHRGGLVNGDAEEPHECDELPGDSGEVPKNTKNEASSGEVDDSSLSSAATKIQASTRGYLARKHMKDTFSTTAPSIADSQQSIGTVQSSQDDDDGVQTSGSVETEVQRHSIEDIENGIISVVISTASDKLIENGDALEEAVETVVTGKGMSLDSQLTKDEKKTSVLTSQSVQNPNGVEVDDDVVWKTLHSEMEEAATKIQSNFRGFSARQKLQREDAVQMGTTSSGTPATASEDSEPPPPTLLQSSGEFHDMIVLPSLTTDVTNQDATS